MPTVLECVGALSRLVLVVIPLLAYAPISTLISPHPHPAAFAAAGDDCSMAIKHDKYIV